MRELLFAMLSFIMMMPAFNLEGRNLIREPYTLNELRDILLGENPANRNTIIRHPDSGRQGKEMVLEFHGEKVTLYIYDRDLKAFVPIKKRFFTEANKAVSPSNGKYLYFICSTCNQKIKNRQEAIKHVNRTGHNVIFMRINRKLHFSSMSPDVQKR